MVPPTSLISPSLVQVSDTVKQRNIYQKQYRTHLHIQLIKTRDEFLRQQPVPGNEVGED